jgi:hypothetical protein
MEEINNDVIFFKKNSAQFKIFVTQFKEDDFWIFHSDSLKISGYGFTEVEAKESFVESLKVFSEDLLDLSIFERNQYLISLGFSKDMRTKNFTFNSINFKNRKRPILKRNYKKSISKSKTNSSFSLLETSFDVL